MPTFFSDIYHYTFLQNALLAAVLASIPCGIIGSFIVARRSTYIAGAISHNLLAGMGLALYLNVVHGFTLLTPLMGAVAAAVTTAVLLSIVSGSKHQRTDTLFSAVWSVGMALGIVFIMLTPGYNEDLMSYLFGNILMVTHNDLILMAALDVIIIVVVSVFYSKLLTISFHRELAELRGLRVKLYEMMYLILTALTVVALVNIVGIVMAIALLTLPAATAGNFFNQLSRMIFAAIFICLLATIGGLAISYQPEWPTGPTIILLSGSGYVISLVGTRIKRG